ncbi:hypothetical protein ACEWY4_021238 [Coilia grayii]|uniref:Arf-GAP domain-containing protein n=1 Tax=Coilia grayii TaxID=363190 RepID=A0ABD1J8G0_9TELE
MWQLSALLQQVESVALPCAQSNSSTLLPDVSATQERIYRPRWASWNLGVFICIRCAGIHRNLGVHISRVKSVNLDQWTPEQIQSVQDMGNTRARQLYEAHLPENFRRPQTDQAVEFFIRDKYEKKKYYDKNAAVNGSIKEREKKKDERKREKDADKGNKPSPLEKQPSTPPPAPHPARQPASTTSGSPTTPSSIHLHDQPSPCIGTQLSSHCSRILQALAVLKRL